jgi:D-glycero-D-manno-heptose 1,7-bisphosphate phosphatase
MTEDDVEAVNEQLAILLKEFGAFVDGVYVCPHEIGVCECRKPMPGLLVRCAAEHPPLRLSHSVMIGDTETDMTAGMVVGAQTILVGTNSTPTAAVFQVSSFEDAVRLVLSED